MGTEAPLRKPRGRHGTPSRRGRAALLVGLVAAAALLLLAGLFRPVTTPQTQGPAAVLVATPPESAGTATVPVAETSAPAVLDDQVTAVADLEFPEGVEMQVGTPDGLRPGLWQSMGSVSCAWSRSRGAGWRLDTGGHPGRPITIALRGTTSWFTTKGCGLWTWAGPG